MLLTGKLVKLILYTENSREELMKKSIKNRLDKVISIDKMLSILIPSLKSGHEVWLSKKKILSFRQVVFEDRNKGTLLKQKVQIVEALSFREQSFSSIFDFLFQVQPWSSFENSLKTFIQCLGSAEDHLLTSVPYFFWVSVNVILHLQTCFFWSSGYPDFSHLAVNHLCDPELIPAV